MKLRQNARELVMLEVSGLGILIGEIRYNKQTETVLFTLEKSAFFDLYFPCAVIYDQKKGAIVHPHIVNTMITSSIRIQKSRVSFFVLESDIAPSVRAQYLQLVNSFIGLSREGAGQGTDSAKGAGKGPERVQPSSQGPRVIPLDKLKGERSADGSGDGPSGRNSDQGPEQPENP